MPSNTIGILLRDASFDGGCKVVTDRLRNEFSNNGMEVKCFSLVTSNDSNYIDINVSSIKRLNSKEVSLVTDTIRKNEIKSLIVQVDSPLSSVFCEGLLNELNSICKLYCVFHNSTSSYFKSYHSVKSSIIDSFARLVYSKAYICPITKKRIKHNLESSNYVTLTKQSQHDLKDRIKNAESTVIPNCIPEIKICVQKKDNICIYVGRLDKYQKNIFLLINAWKMLPDNNNWKMIIVGAGKEDAAIKDYCKFDKNIEIVGSKSNSEILELLKTSQILAISSNYEGLPTVAVEAMASCNAILTTNFDGIDDSLLKNNYNCLISKRNVVEYYHNLQLLIKDEKMRQRLAYNGRTLYEEMDNKMVVQKWYKLLGEEK